jgi:hypothetical protein
VLCHTAGQTDRGQFRVTGWPGDEAALAADLKRMSRSTVMISGEEYFCRLARRPSRWINMRQRVC